MRGRASGLLGHRGTVGTSPHVLAIAPCGFLAFVNGARSALDTVRGLEVWLVRGTWLVTHSIVNHHTISMDGEGRL